jgi:hypothetical protein
MFPLLRLTASILKWAHQNTAYHFAHVINGEEEKLNKCEKSNKKKNSEGLK